MEPLPTAAAAPRRSTFLLAALVVLGAVCLIVGTCAVLLNRINLGDRKADHIFPLAGGAPLTNEQTLELARRVLVLDGRDLANLTLEQPADVDTNVTTHPSSTSDPDGSYTLTYRHRETGWFWYVTLKRENGRVVGYSYHGL